MKKARIFILLLLPAVVLTAGCGGGKARVGKPLPAWSEGCLDIHAVNTARGECTFLILPDGTTLTVDAGEFSSEPKKYRSMPQKPDSLTRPTRTYARYMRHFMPYKDSLDYFLLTHFHMDHLGQLEPEYGRSAGGDYVLSGVTALYDELPFREIVDRAYPAYDSLACLAMSTASLANYRRFIDHATEHNGLKAAMLRLGDSGQFPLRRRPERYPDFRITGICSNGCVWDGEKVVNHYGDGTLRENGASCGILLSYGDFDYFTAGDAGGNTRVEYPCARSIGRPVEAMKSHHHLSPHTMQDDMLAARPGDHPPNLGKQNPRSQENVFHQHRPFADRRRSAALCPQRRDRGTHRHPGLPGRKGVLRLHARRQRHDLHRKTGRRPVPLQTPTPKHRKT